MMTATDTTSQHGAPDQRPDDEKTKELIVYLSQHSENDDAWGVTKLNKLLFFIDFGSYLYFGRSVTGQAYQRKQYGPCPCFISSTRDRLVRDGSIKIGSAKNGRQRRLIATRPANASIFESSELEFVDKVVKKWRTSSASRMSDLSHTFVGWQIVEPDEVIPYNLVLVNLDKRAPKTKEIAYANFLSRIPKEERRKVTP